MINGSETIRRKRLMDSAEKELPSDKKICQTTSPIPLDTMLIDLESNMGEASRDQTMLEILKEVKKIDAVSRDVTSIKEDMQSLKESLIDTQQQLAEACEEIEILKAGQNKVDWLESEVRYLKEKTSVLEKKIEDQNRYSRRENIIIKGVPESEGEDCLTVINGIFTKLGVGPFQLQRFHRLGLKKDNAQRSRPLIVRFLSFQDKLTVLRKRGQLRGTQIYFQDDMSKEIEMCQNKLRPVLNYIRRVKPMAQVSLIEDKLRYNGKVYTTETIKEIPIDTAEIGTDAKEKVVYFAGEFSPLSNLYACNLTIDDKEYSSVEQFYQYQKAMDQKEPELAFKIMESNNARMLCKLANKLNAQRNGPKQKVVRS